jgi:uncharacterized protein YbaP (TraB family)
MQFKLLSPDHVLTFTGSVVRSLGRVVAGSLAALVVGSAMAEESLPPRMWKFTLPNGAQSYLFGATHFGVAAEYDDYFRQKVEPAFRGASAFLLEAAVMAPQPECPEPLKSEAAKADIAAAREVVRKLEEANYRSIRDATPAVGWTNAVIVEMAKSAAQDASEYALIQAARLFAPVADAPEDQGRPPPADVPVAPAARLASLRPQLPRVSIDQPADILAAYCAAGEQRIEHFRQTFKDIERWRTHGQPQSEKDDARRKTTVSLRSLLTSGKLDPSFTPDPLHKWLICERNPRWLKGMLAAEPDSARFYLVGMAHLFPVESDAGGCPGLLQDLAKAGARVELVK